MTPPPSLTDTLEQILEAREPNFLRTYLSPHVAQACYVLDRYVRTTWTDPGEDCQSFLANGLEEALGGAIKLLRYQQRAPVSRKIALVVDPADRLTGFADVGLADGERIEYLPGVHVVGTPGYDRAPVDLLALVATDDGIPAAYADPIRLILQRDKPAVIACVTRQGLESLRAGAPGLLRELTPDVVIFDESFVDRAVPFAAFSARRSLFRDWNRPGKSTFHSTTFQPNTVSTRHFMRCLAAADPGFAREHDEDLRAIQADLSRRGDAFRRYYHPALYRLIKAAGFETTNVLASGSFVVVNGCPIFDVVGGVACSVRGHNPPAYVDETSAPSSEVELRVRLRHLTGLGSVLPAVSGATAVENALKLALVARFPRRHILALQAGFGGKTLFALTGTANPSYKERVGPLYADVHYVDPFAPDALQQIDAVLASFPVAAVLMELIQSVGGVRRLPESVVRHLEEGRTRWGYLLVVDEVQTGLYRTGPFSQTRAFGLTPDLMLLGKGTSDMMFPFSLTLYSDAVAEAVASRVPALVQAIERRYGYERGYRTVANVLRLAEEQDLPERVHELGERFEGLLRAGLDRVPGVRDVRVFGLLVAIELEARTGLRRWLRKRLGAAYLLALLRHEEFPILAGFCQYEPNTLKLTPPLNADPDDLERASRALVDVLRRPFPRVLLSGLARLLMPSPIRKANHERRNDPTPELAAH
jgi:acetylornithine/succinyldiaminopimelate/putrescine aminotransferase